MIQHSSDLFYDIYNTINEHSKLFWYHFLSELKSSFITASASSLIMFSLLSLFECIKRASSLFMEEIKLIAVVSVSKILVIYNNNTEIL